MAHQEENQSAPEKPKPSQSLIKEATDSIVVELGEYLNICHDIARYELELATLRKKKAEFLRAKPWIGNIQGVINKEALKEAEKALEEPEVPNPEDVQAEEAMNLDPFEKKVPESIPKKAKSKPKNLEELEAAKKSRNRLFSKIDSDARRLAERRPQSSDPSHPTLGSK